MVVPIRFLFCRSLPSFQLTLFLPPLSSPLWPTDRSPFVSLTTFMPPRKLRSASVRAGRGARLTSRGGRGRGGRDRGHSGARGAGGGSPAVRRGRRRDAANMVTYSRTFSGAIFA